MEVTASEARRHLCAIIRGKPPLYFGFSTAAEHMPRVQEVMGSNHAGARRFSTTSLFSYLPFSVESLKQVNVVGATLLIQGESCNHGGYSVLGITQAQIAPDCSVSPPFPTRVTIYHFPYYTWLY